MTQNGGLCCLWQNIWLSFYPSIRNNNGQGVIMSNHNYWTNKDSPEQTGRIAIVTGANSGIGYETARVLAQKGARVIMACRSMGKANKAAIQIRAENPIGKVEVMQLDLADLDSIHSFADDFKTRYPKLDLLINNAGIMLPPFSQTKQGFEIQFGVNHLGHFALTGLLLDELMRTKLSRIVTVSSIYHRLGRIDFENLNAEKEYSANAAYGQSKLANLLFTFELDRKLQAVRKEPIATAAHPGWSKTNLQQYSRGYKFLNRFLGQSPEIGALPILRAATAPDVQGGDYYGPNKRMGLLGYPELEKPNDRSRDAAVATNLWNISEILSGVHYSFEADEIAQISPTIG